jgi:hypothetical protein
MTSANGLCVFCETRPGSTKEHGWPQWLLEWWTRYAADHGTTASSTFTLETDDAVLRKFKGDLTIGGFCECCNAGWMSVAEDRAKQVLPDLIVGTDCSLTMKQQRALAKWLVLKSLVLMLATPDQRVPASWYRRLFRDRLPPISVSLFACDTFYAGSWNHTQTLSSPADSFHSIFRLGHAVLQVLGHPVAFVTDPNLRRGLDQYRIVLWPPGTAARFPTERLITVSDLEALSDYPPAQPDEGNGESLGP